MLPCATWTAAVATTIVGVGARSSRAAFRPKTAAQRVPAQNQSFVGSAKCAKCHAGMHRKWAGAGTRRCCSRRSRRDRARRLLEGRGDPARRAVCASGATVTASHWRRRFRPHVKNASRGLHARQPPRSALPDHSSGRSDRRAAADVGCRAARVVSQSRHRQSGRSHAESRAGLEQQLLRLPRLGSGEGLRSGATRATRRRGPISARTASDVTVRAPRTSARYADAATPVAAASAIVVPTRSG